MDTSKNTDQLFSKLRGMPEEISHEKVAQFVLANVALGLTTAATLKGAHKLFYKFHFNTIAIMITAVGASVVSVFLLGNYFSKSPKVADQINNKAIQQSNHSTVTGFAVTSDTPSTTAFASATNNMTSASSSSSASTSNKVRAEKPAFSFSNVYFYSGANGCKTNADSANAAAQGSAIVTVNSTDPNFVPCKKFNETKTDTTSTSSSDLLIRNLKKALLADHLISNETLFTFSIDSRAVRVNGKKMSKDVWRKYKGIVETSTPNTVNRKFSYELIVKGEEITMNVRNYED